MRKEYLDKEEDNASVCTWSEKTQLEKGNSVTEGYTSELWDFTRINSTQNEFKELRNIWAQSDAEAKQLFCQNYGDLPYLLDIKKLMMITGMSERWATARIQQKGDGKCIPLTSLRDLILAHPDVKRRVDVLALSIYGLVIFPKAMGHTDEAVADLVDRLAKQNTPVPAILAETFRSFNACWRVGEGRFIGCAQLLLVWFYSHFWKVDKVPCRVFFKDYSPLKEATTTLRRDDITEERWIEILQNLREEDVMWKAPWVIPSEILYRCGSFDWILTKGPTTTVEYKGWFCKRANDKIPRSSLEAARSMEENLRVITSELEVMKQEFERKNLELGRKIERLEEENMYLSLDIDIQKIEVEKVRKEKRKIEKDRDDLKTHYKKTQLLLKRAGLGKSSEQWQQEVQEERAKAEYWEKKFQEMQAQNQALEKENQGLNTKVTELGRSLHHHQSRNSAVELKASLNKIEEMKHNIGRLEAALQNCELRIEQLEPREGHWKEELHHL
ncbi:hypothetical protein CXB51_013597 [Gossypium anomalum]|uniref:DUF7745 domain-containing protein n=1 Tax=Gossypium anomalum TaxID=47600 RepID=A0A8J5YW87_9ROSI|nr:hypothetical protein CXB51_013597 [Gossypium anomalum]